MRTRARLYQTHLTRPNPAEVLNGVAHDPATGHLWVTGKNWPLMFEIELLGN